MQKKLLEIDGEDLTTLDEFIAANTAPDVDQPAPAELEAVRALGLNESTVCGMCTVTRIV